MQFSLKENRVYCVIDENGYYKELVNVEVFLDEETGKETKKILDHEMQSGETLVLRTDECRQPTIKLHINTKGFVRPRWDGKAWIEGATSTEIAAWEREHPAPPPQPPTEVEMLQEENRLLRAQITAESDRTDFIEDCIAEMVAQVYV